MPSIDYAPFRGYPELGGVFVGGCVDRGDGSSFRRRAHAHYKKKGLHPSWICVRSAKRLYTPSGGPSQLMLHELAHILTPDWCGHNDKWRAKAQELGYRLPARYQKK